MAFSYKLGPGELSSRAAPPVPFSLAEASGREAYREWRVQAESYASTQGKLRVIEESVRDQLIASLGTSIRTALVAQFQSNLKSATVFEIIGFLDSRFAYLSDTEDVRLIDQFYACKRSTSESLGSFLLRWQATLERAVSAGYTPASDLSDMLLTKSNATTDQVTKVISAARKHELETKEPLKGNDRHSLFFKELSECAAVNETVKHSRAQMSAPLKANSATEAANTAAPGGKGRKRERSKKTKTTTTDGEGAASAATESEPPKKKKGPPKQAAPSTSNTDLVTALTTALIQGQGKGKGGWYFGQGWGKGKGGKGGKWGKGKPTKPGKGKWGKCRPSSPPHHTQTDTRTYGAPKS